MLIQKVKMPPSAQSVKSDEKNEAQFDQFNDEKISSNKLTRIIPEKISGQKSNTI